MCSFPFFPCSPDISIRSKRLPSWLSQLRFSKLRQPTGQRLSNIRTQQRKIPIWPILFLYHEESLLSSNLNSKQLRFHPNIYNHFSRVVASRWNGVGTSTEVSGAAKWRDVDRLSQRHFSEWRDLDRLSASNRLNILSVGSTIYSELPDWGVAGQLRIRLEQVDWESVRSALAE